MGDLVGGEFPRTTDMVAAPLRGLHALAALGEAHGPAQLAPGVVDERQRPLTVWRVFGGQRGAIDTGHPDSHEVFFVIRGHVLVNTTERDCFELRTGDVEVSELLPPEALTGGVAADG